MRNGQNKRMRGRNRKGQNPLTRVYESNGPDVKIRGTPSHIAEKYIQLARDATTSGDPVSAENYFQHAEHYFRLIAAAQEQFRQANPYYRPEGEQQRDDSFDGDEDGGQPMGGDGGYGGSQPYMPQAQPYQQQPYPPREQPYVGPRDPQQYGGRPPHQQHVPQGRPEGELPSFITGGAQPQSPPQPQGHQSYGPNGYDAQQHGQHGQPDRFPLHRRRRRRHGGPPRPDMQGGQQQHHGGGEGGGESASPGPAGETQQD